MPVVGVSVLARALARTHLQVNTLHHQAVRAPGLSLRAVARSSDGLIEGVEHVARDFVVGIQCHPEELSTSEEWAARLFDSFVFAARERSCADNRTARHA
jgi:putative glutamine amidotransferase